MHTHNLTNTDGAPPTWWFCLVATPCKLWCKHMCTSPMDETSISFFLLSMRHFLNWTHIQGDQYLKGETESDLPSLFERRVFFNQSEKRNIFAWNLWHLKTHKRIKWIHQFLTEDNFPCSFTVVVWQKPPARSILLYFFRIALLRSHLKGQCHDIPWFFALFCASKKWRLLAQVSRTSDCLGRPRGQSHHRPQYRDWDSAEH